MALQLPSILTDYQDRRDIKGSPIILSPNTASELPTPIQPSIVYMEAALPAQLQPLSSTKLSLDCSLDARLRNILPLPSFIRSSSSSNSLASTTSSFADDESFETLEDLNLGCHRATSIPLLLNPIEDQHQQAPQQHQHQQQQQQQQQQYDNSRQYHCTFCQKKFMRPSSLKIHIYSHTGEKPFHCSYPGCRRKFSVQSNMRRHLRVHFN